MVVARANVMDRVIVRVYSLQGTSPGRKWLRLQGLISGGC